MAQCAETQQFLKRVASLPKGPGVSLDGVLKPSIEYEAGLRRLFATNRNDTLLKNPYVGLVDVFQAPSAIRTTRARVFKDKEDETAKYVLSLSEKARRKDGTPCVVDNLEQFKKNWAIFSEGALSQLTDWNNVVAAGGGVLACLLPLSDEVMQSKRNIRKYYHSDAFPTSDVDLFLWGMDEKQAEQKLNQIYEAVRDSVPWEVTCVRTKNVVSIHCQYPYRTIQIVLRLYHSPAEILAGFDIDSGCFLYDGKAVYGNPRAVVSVMRQCNTVDMTRRSPSYEVRLAKYAARGFEVYVDDLRRADVDPTIFERAANSVLGLARLLVLEKLTDPTKRTSYLEDRRAIRSRPNENRNNIRWRRERRRQRRKFKGDLKADDDVAGLETNDYDKEGNAGLHIPYGPGWDAARINRLIYKTDLGMNSTFNPKNKGRRLHHHPAFFGTMKECTNDCCRHCPVPKDDEERALQEKEDETYVRGRVSFMKIDPGRQSMTGSFHPIDVGEWSEQAYVGPTEKLFNAIASHDLQSVQQLVAQGIDVNRRDYIGRTALHIAIMVKAVDVTKFLIDNGARMTARLVDGRTSLHLAANLDLPDVVLKLLERSRWNEERVKEAEEAAKRAEMDTDDGEMTDRPSSEDDWSSDENDGAGESQAGANSAKKADEQQVPPESAALPEDNVDQPDIVNINTPDWDMAFTPLIYAIVAGSVRCVDILLAAGATYKLESVEQPVHYFGGPPQPILHPLLMPIFTADEKSAIAITERLIRAGATTSQAGHANFTILHSLIASGKIHLVETALRNDPNAKAALNILFLNYANAIHPLVTAIALKKPALVSLLLLYGANARNTKEELEKLALTSKLQIHNLSDFKIKEYHYIMYHPLETAVSTYSDLVDLLTQIGADVYAPVKCTLMPALGVQSINTLLDWVKQYLPILKAEPVTSSITINLLEAPTDPKTWLEHRDAFQSKLELFRKERQDKQNRMPVNQEEYLKKEREAKERQIAYLENLLMILTRSGAKQWKDLKDDLINPAVPLTDFQKSQPLMPLVAVQQSPSSVQPSRSSRPGMIEGNTSEPAIPTLNYKIMAQYGARGYVPSHQKERYAALFEACWTGDNKTIEELCLPASRTETSPLPLQITVQSDSFESLGGFVHRTNMDGIYTPFSVAVTARKWGTAKLVLAIAAAQYKKQEEVETAYYPPPIQLRDGDIDVDYGSDTAPEDDDYVMKEVIAFEDVLKRSSLVQVDIKPETLFNCVNGAKLSLDGSSEIFAGSLMIQAIQDEDFEAFVNLADMMKMMSGQINWHPNTLDTILSVDSSILLDEYIRRTGLGITVEDTEEEPEVDHGEHFVSDVYLGLDVEGKKRKDLAMRGHQKQKQTTENVPLLWMAAIRGSQKIIRYLSSMAPLAAYKYFAASGSDPRAELLRKAENLDADMPRLLGVFPNSRNETLMTAVSVSNNKLEIAKLVLSLYPDQAKNYLHSKIRENDMTTLLLAVFQNPDNDFIDWLLDQGVDPEAVDYRGWNVYHFACSTSNLKILQRLLQKLPHEVTTRLLQQGSRREYTTPLALAVRSGALRIVETLFEAHREIMRLCLQKHNASGSTPLHIAVHAGFSRLTALLASEASADDLEKENAVGETSLEIAYVQWLISMKSNTNIPQAPPNIPSIPSTGLMAQKPAAANPDDVRSEIVEMKNLLIKAAEQGLLWQNAKLKKALESYIEQLQLKLQSAQPVVEEKYEILFDSMDRARTLEIMTSAVLGKPGFRRLVHLRVVQKSVQMSLDKSEQGGNEEAANSKGFSSSKSFPGVNVGNGGFSQAMSMMRLPHLVARA